MNRQISKAAKKGGRKLKPKSQPQPLQQLPSLLSRGEVIGVVLVFLSAITLLSLLTSSKGILTSTWLGGLETLFGVGMWGFPVVTGVLAERPDIDVLRNAPLPSGERTEFLNDWRPGPPVLRSWIHDTTPRPLRARSATPPP